MIQRLLGIALALALTACGGGGDGDGASPGAPETVSRVEIVQTGLVLTEVGAGKALKAVAYGASGSVIDATFSWQSTRPEAVSVAADGFATALRANGTALVVATAGGVVSAPLLVAVTAPAAGAVLLTDSQIVGEPVETDALATPSFSNTYRAVLAGVPPPPIGALVVSTESKAVAGRVVATSVAGTQTTVTLALVSIRELFPNLNIDEVIDLSRAPVEFAPEIIAQYDIARTNNTFTFTPKLQVGSSAASGGRVFRAAAAGTRALPPFSQCESSITGFAEGSPLPIALSAPPLFSVTIAPKLSLLYTGANGVERFVVSAQPTVKVEGGVSVAVAFEGKVECGVDLFTLRIPIGGPLSFVVGGLVPVGVGLEVGGKVTVATLAIGTKVEAGAKAEIGVACPGGSGCTLVRSVGDISLSATPTITTPSLANLRVEPSIAAFGTVKAAVGNPFFKSLRFEALKVKAGGKLEGSFAPQVTQLLDTAYKSDYKLSFEASAGAGADLSGALSLLGLTGVSAIELKISNDLATSPAGLATGAVTTSIARAGTSTTSDPARFQTGDAVSVTVKLDPATTTFLGLYNVNRVLLVRNTGGQQTEVGRVVAAAGQTEFNFAVVAADAGSVSEFSAFTVTALLPLDLLALETGVAQGGGARLRGTVNIDFTTLEIDDSPGLFRPARKETTLTLTGKVDEQSGRLVMSSSVARGSVFETSSDIRKFVIVNKSSGLECRFEHVLLSERTTLLVADARQNNSVDLTLLPSEVTATEFGIKSPTRVTFKSTALLRNKAGDCTDIDTSPPLDFLDENDGATFSVSPLLSLTRSPAFRAPLLTDAAGRRSVTLTGSAQDVVPTTPRKTQSQTAALSAVLADEAL